jgi:outer membrane protein assembly factor BamB
MSSNESTPRKPLRLWPGVIAASLLVLVGYVVPLVVPDGAGYGMIGAVVGALIIILWWLFFSRARWYERLGGLLVMIAALVPEHYVVHPSIAGGAMGFMAYFLTIPTLCVALVAWAVVSRRLSVGARGAAAVAAVVLGCLPWTLVRTGGIAASGKSDFHWRWTPTPEERLLAQAREEPVVVPALAAAPDTPAPASIPTVVPTPDKTPTLSPPVPEKAAIWPGFRGPNRDDVIHGVHIETDWTKSPPVELWRRTIGPGWSSFAVRGSLVYTQEQRGEDEDVSCYNLTTGTLVWRHRDRARFWESNAGAGPRGTPTVINGRVYTLGATGIANALDANTGAVVWSHNAQADTGATRPMWAFASSPLVVDDLVIVAASGRLVAYDVTTGSPRWFAQTGGGSYSSPHLMTIGGVPQVLMQNGSGVSSVAPATGKVLWKHAWEGVPILQPAQTADGDVLLAAADMSGGLGIRRLAVARGSGGWTVQERWTSRGLKAYFNDFVVHNGHAFGFDGSILSCIDLQDGTRKWKGGRYGNGQLVLLADQDLLLVLSEEGELALVKAAADQFTEVAKFPSALEGKTWNHPVLVGDVLLVRNDHEMAAFRLSPAVSTTEATAGR